MAVEVFGLLDGEMNPLQQKDVATLTSFEGSADVDAQSVESCRATLSTGSLCAHHSRLHKICDNA